MSSVIVARSCARACSAASPWDKLEALGLIRHFCTAFLLATLKGDETAAKALAPESVVLDRVTY